MDEVKKGAWRYKKVLATAFIIVSIAFVIIALSLQMTGVLGSARQYETLASEAKVVGLTNFPSTPVKNPTKDAGPVLQQVNKSLTALLKGSRLHPEAAVKPSKSYVWPPKSKAIYDAFLPDLTKLETIDSTWTIETEPPQDRRIKIDEIHIRTLQNFATNLANQGDDEGAAKAFYASAMLARWKLWSTPFIRALGRSNILNLIRQIETFQALRQGKGPLYHLIGELCDLALQPIDFREIYQDYAKLLLPGLDSVASTGGYGSLNTPMGRSALMLKFPLVTRAAKADILRSYLAAYKILKQDPYSFELAEKAEIAASDGLDQGNSITRSLLQEVSAPKLAKTVKPFFDQLKIIRSKYPS